MTPQFVFMSPKAEKICNIMKNRYIDFGSFEFSLDGYQVLVIAKNGEEVSVETLNDMRMFALGAYEALTF